MDHRLIRSPLTVHHDRDSGELVLTSEETNVLWLPKDTALNLVHELARLIVDRCPCHRGQTFDNMTGQWEIIL